MSLLKMIETRRGVTRTVFLTKRYAIKVPRLKDCKGHKAWTFVRGWSANMSEVDWTGYASIAHGNPQVCPVLKSYLFGIINVYPRVELIAEENLDEMYDLLEFKTPSDVHVGNLGYYKGHPVWTDYDMNWNDCRRCGGRKQHV
jgi:hypothetical protein